MRQKLFTKEIDNKLFAQYKYGSDLSKQMVVAKIFNPFNRGQWYIINSDPNDPDYLWAIVDLFEIEAGSVSREDLQTIKVPPFGLNLERDLYFQPINAQELYNRLRQGERFEHGGSVDVIQNDKDESYLTSVNAKPNDAAIKLAHGGMSESVEVGDLVRVKKYGFIMRVDKIEGNMYFLENDKRGSMNGNNGSYLISDIEKYEKYADGGGIYGIEKYLSKNLIDHISSLNEEQLKKMKKELLNEIERSEKYDKDFKGSNRQFSLNKELDLVNYRLGVEDKMADGGETDGYTKSLALVTVKFSNPEYNYSTNLSGSVSEADARKYFVGKSFNVGKYPKENMQKCIDIDFKAKGTYAEGGETAKSWTVMYFKEGKNRFGEKIESAFNNTRVQGTLKDAIEKVKEELVDNISYATIKDRSIGDVLVAKVKQDGTINIYREGYGIDKMAKGGTTKSYIYVPKSDIKEIDAVIGGKEQKISGKDVLDGAYVKKSVPKVDKGKLSERAQILLDSTMESFERQNDRQRAASIKQVEDNLAANKKGIDNIGMGLDEDMVAAGEEFLKIVKSKKYEDKPEIELGTFKEARYAKGKVLYIPPPTGSDNWKNRQMKLAEAKGISGKYTNREKGYIMSKSQAEKLKKYILEGYDASAFTGELIKPEDSYKKGGVTFKDKVKSISNSLKGKKVPSKLKKDYGATYDKKESVLAATRIAGAMKAKMESKKKR